MQNRFIPNWHMRAAAEKLTPEWAYEAVEATYFSKDNINLLGDKKVWEIDSFSEGNFSMDFVMRMFKSIDKQLRQQQDPSCAIVNIDTKGLSFEQLALIPQKLNAAIALGIKIPVEFTCTATDALAAEKKDEDIEFLKNKPVIEEDLQPIADRLGIGKVDLGTTKHADTQYGDSPYGLDLSKPNQLDIFKNLLYSLNIETSFETALQDFWETLDGKKIEALLRRDQLRYGISVDRAFVSSTTGLPDHEYVFPGDMEVPDSNLPDFSDNGYRFRHKTATALEFMNLFSSEVGSLEKLDKILNDNKEGYLFKNQQHAVKDQKEWSTLNLQLVYCEIKSVDWIGVNEKTNSKRGFKSFTTDEKMATRKIWAQNTYAFWWLKNTKHIFGIEKLPFATRTLGQETIQNFTTSIEKSLEKSAVELSIGENKVAQIAYIKLQHALIKSLPAGKLIDLKGLRSALGGLNDDGDAYTINELLRLAMEENYIIIDTEGFDGPNDGQLKPFYELRGGVSLAELQGYYTTIENAKNNISQLTGVNDQLTGTSANAEGLVGLQKLMMNASINQLHYVNVAVERHTQKKANVWAAGIKAAVERGGKPRKAIEAIVGKKKTSLIDGIKEVPLHQIGVHVSIEQREVERAQFEQKQMELKQRGVINAADEFIISAVKNPKDKMALLAVREEQFLERQREEREAGFAQQQQLVQQQGANMQGVVQAENEGKIQHTYAKGDVEAKLMQLGSQLGLSEKEMDGLIKRALQQDRNQAQLNKGVQLLDRKSALKQQEVTGI